MADEEGELQPIIVKKIKKGGGHHGGAWKVAYADFVTAMMAFFLLLWLLNVTTDEQKNAISNYFDPTHPQVSESDSGAGGVLGGLSVAPQGAMTTNVQPITSPAPQGSAVNNRSSAKNGGDKAGRGDTKTEEEMAAEALERAKDSLRKAEEQRMEDAKKALEKAIEANPELAKLKENLLIDMTPEGLRIQVIDQKGNPMFASGSARMFEKTEKLLLQVGEVVKTQSNEISIRGHTDSVPYGKGADYTNWELSSDRANSSRRVLLESGLKPERIFNVVGKADTEHLVPQEPESPRNRRISIVLLKQELTDPDFAKKALKHAEEEARKAKKAEDERKKAKAAGSWISYPQPVEEEEKPYEKTPGAVEFP